MFRVYYSPHFGFVLSLNAQLMAQDEKNLDMLHKEAFPLRQH